MNKMNNRRARLSVWRPVRAMCCKGGRGRLGGSGNITNGKKSPPRVSSFAHGVYGNRIFQHSLLPPLVLILTTRFLCTDTIFLRQGVLFIRAQKFGRAQGSCPIRDQIQSGCCCASPKRAAAAQVPISHTRIYPE